MELGPPPKHKRIQDLSIWAYSAHFGDDYTLWQTKMAGWKIEFSTGNTSSNGSFSSAMLVYQSVFFWI